MSDSRALNTSPSRDRNTFLRSREQAREREREREIANARRAARRPAHASSVVHGPADASRPGPIIQRFVPARFNFVSGCFERVLVYNRLVAGLREGRALERPAHAPPLLHGPADAPGPGTTFVLETTPGCTRVF